MESWKDNLTEEQLQRVEEAEIKAGKIVARNKPLIKKLNKLKKKYIRKYLK